MNYRSESKQIYERFRALPGSEHIATAAAIEGLMKWVGRKRPRNILEVGAGIGTLTFTLMSTLERLGRPFRLTCLEDNEFCLSQLRSNLSEYLQRFQVLPSVRSLPGDIGEFDFVIIDGGATSAEYYGSLAPRALIFVEGWRLQQREVIASLPRTSACCGIRDPSRKGQYFYWMCQMEPTPAERLRFRAINGQNRLRKLIEARLPEPNAGLASQSRPR